MQTDPSRWEMVDDAMAVMLRQMTPGQRLAVTNDLWEMARRTLRSQLTKDHPNWTAAEINGEITKQLSQGVVPSGCDVVGWFNDKALRERPAKSPLVMSSDLRAAVAQAGGHPVRLVDPETNAEYVMVPAICVDRLIADMYDDSPWTADDALLVAAEAGRSIGWDDMDEYDSYPDKPK